VPDPYYGGMDGFRNVVELIERGCGPLLDHVLTLEA
jgi:protein-tyrosine-phosphatase